MGNTYDPRRSGDIKAAMKGASLYDQDEEFDDDERPMDLAPVDANLCSLNEKIARLDDLVKKLGVKLQPVSRRDDMTSAEVPYDYPGTSVVCQTLARQSAQLEELGNVVLYYINDLEV